MREFLTSPIWQFLGTILAFVAIVVSIALYVKQRRYKSLSYRIISYTSLLSVREDTKGELKIFFNDCPVEDGYLIVVELKNTGTLPVSKEDFENSIDFNFKNAALLSSDIIDTKPKGLPAGIFIRENTASLDPVLLNPGDSLVLKLLVNGKGDFEVYSRIRGVKDIPRTMSWDRPIRFTKSIVLGIEFGSAFLGAGIALLILTPLKDTTVVGAVSLALGVLVFTGVIWNVLSQSKRSEPL